MYTLAQVSKALPNGEYIYHYHGATVDDYMRFADEDTRLELIDGVLTLHSSASVRHEETFIFLLTLVNAVASATKAGEALGSRVAVVLADNRRFEPDILFLKEQNTHRLGEEYVHGPVDWIVEILSPATRDYDLGNKRRIYADAGIPELWYVDLAQNRLLIERPAGKRVADIQAGRADCEALAGFWIKADWLWQDSLPSAFECLNKILAC